MAKKKRKKMPLPVWDDYEYRPTVVDVTQYADFDDATEREGNNISEAMLLDVHSDSGFVFGLKAKYGSNKYVGIPQGAEGNTLGVGGIGAGKSTIAKATSRLWNGALCATDIKGELSTYYAKLFEGGIVERPYNVFDPMDIDGIGYDPFWWLKEDAQENLVGNIWEIAIAIIPLPHDARDPFWIETEQGILAAALLYYYQRGESFSDTITNILESTVTGLVNTIVANGDKVAEMYLGELIEMKAETRANFDRGLRNKLMKFADPYILNSFRSSHEGAGCFTWDDLDECNIFLKIPANRIEQWGGAINLMLTQLIRHLERRPDKYSPEGANNIQTLLLLDEFARFGKLEMISSAMATLRSKCVNICLMIQSLAQLDRLYGEYERRIILDNCQYVAILRANDAETQRYLSDLIGSIKVISKSTTVSLNGLHEFVGQSAQMGETREPMIFPQQLATLKDILLLTPDGFCRVEKIPIHGGFPAPQDLPTERKSFVMERRPQEPNLLSAIPKPAPPGAVLESPPVVAKRIKPDATRWPEKGGV